MVDVSLNIMFVVSFFQRAYMCALVIGCTNGRTFEKVNWQLNNVVLTLLPRVYFTICKKALNEIYAYICASVN